MTRRLNLLAATIISASLPLGGAAQAAKPISKSCGPNDHYTIGFSQANFKEPYRAKMNDDLVRLTKNYPQFKIILADGQANDNTQVSQVENFLTQQVDLLLISAFEAAPLTPAVTRVMKAGIPVIEMDRKTVGDDYTSFVTGDNRDIARQAGVYAATKLMPEGGEVAILEGLPSSSPAIERLEGFKAGIAGNPKLKVVAVQPVDWMQDKAVTVFGAMLQSHPEIKLVYACNDLAAAGAYIAVKQAGKLGQVKIIGTDGLPGPSGGIRAVADGEWSATMVYPTGAAEALDLAKRILLDCATSVPKLITVPTKLIDASNARAIYAKGG